MVSSQWRIIQAPVHQVIVGCIGVPDDQQSYQLDVLFGYICSSVSGQYGSNPAPDYLPKWLTWSHVDHSGLLVTHAPSIGATDLTVEKDRGEPASNGGGSTGGGKREGGRRDTQGDGSRDK